MNELKSKPDLLDTKANACNAYNRPFQDHLKFRNLW